MNVTIFPTMFTKKADMAAPQSPPSPPPKTVSGPASEEMKESITDTSMAPESVNVNDFSTPMLRFLKKSLTNTSASRTTSA